MKLYIDSGTHSFTDPERRLREIRDNLQSPGVVFKEGSDSPLTARKLAKGTTIAPLLVPVMSFWVFVILPVLEPLFGDDREIEKRIVQEYDAREIAVDAPKLDIIIQDWKLWGGANWLLVFATISRVSGPANTLVMLAIQGVAIFVAYLAAINPSRNEHMAKEIAKQASTASEAVFVTGSEHHEPVAERLASCSDVEVLNPVRNQD